MNNRQKIITLISLFPVTAAALAGCGPIGRSIPKHGPDDVYHSKQVMCGSTAGIDIAQQVYHDPTIVRYKVPKNFQEFVDLGYLCNLTWYTNSEGKATEAHLALADGTGAGSAAWTDLMRYPVSENGNRAPNPTQMIPPTATPVLEQAVQPTSAPSLTNCNYTIQEGDTLSYLFFESKLAPAIMAAYDSNFERFVQDLGLSKPDQLGVGQKLSFWTRVPAGTDISELCR